MSGDHSIHKANTEIWVAILGNGGIGFPISRQTVVVTGYPVDHDRCIGVFPMRIAKKMIRFANAIAMSRDENHASWPGHRVTYPEGYRVSAHRGTGSGG
jgi:hypothetical protein